MIKEIDYEKRINSMKVKNITYKDTKEAYNTLNIRDIGETSKINEILDYIMRNDDNGNCDSQIKLSVLFKLGIMEGKRQERAKKKGAVAIG